MSYDSEIKFTRFRVSKIITFFFRVYKFKILIFFSQFIKILNEYRAMETIIFYIYIYTFFPSNFVVNFFQRESQSTKDLITFCTTTRSTDCLSIRTHGTHYSIKLLAYVMSKHLKILYAV